MSGLAKFFFGGIVGAVIGILMSPKRAQKVREALQSLSVSGDSRHLAAAPASEVLSADAVELAAQPAAEPLSAKEDLAAPESAPAPVQIAQEPETGEVSVAEPPSFEEPVIAEVEPDVAAQPMVGAAESVEATETAETIEVAETIETEPEIAEEPAVISLPEPVGDAGETLVPPADADAQEPELEPEAVEVTAEPRPERAEEVPPAPYVTAYSPPPAPEAILEAQPEPVWEPATIPGEPELGSESPDLEATVDEDWAVADAPLAEAAYEYEPESPPEEVAPEAEPEPQPPFEETVAQPEEPTPGAEPEETVRAAYYQAMTAPGAVPSPADLKARIEETRRRIRRELAHPFSGDRPQEQADQLQEQAAVPTDLFAKDEAPLFAAPEPESVADPSGVAEETMAEVTPAEAPAFDEPLESFPDFAEEAALAFRQAEAEMAAEQAEMPAYFEPITDIGAAAEPEAITEPAAFAEPELGGEAEISAEPEVTAEPEPAPDQPEQAPELVAALPGGGFDHEAMRRRIEETRNRLKAKAFDAMMSGESALLRESKAESSEAPTLTVEPEVDQTVETALTEEEF